MLNLKSEQPYLLVDSSYLTYSRFFATITWYGKINNISNLPSDYNWVENKEFLNRFRQNYFVNIDIYKEKYNIPDENIFIIRDCPREEIWRKKIYPEYKATRDNQCDYKDNKFNIGELFKYTYQNIYPNIIKNREISILKYDNLEADDVIALLKNRIRQLYENRLILILTNDNDFLQLKDKYTMIWNVHNKMINNRNKETAEDILIKKVLYGDKSDNIEPVVNQELLNKNFNNWINNKDILMDEINKNSKFKANFLKNLMLIDFNNIPREYTKELEELMNKKIKAPFQHNKSEFLEFCKVYRNYKKV